MNSKINASDFNTATLTSGPQYSINTEIQSTLEKEAGKLRNNSLDQSAPSSPMDRNRQMLPSPFSN